MDIKKICILIVEDERIVAEDIQLRLQNLGYTVVDLVPSGKKALDSIAKKKPDVVLMDIVLEGVMNGIETSVEIRRKFDIPVVYLTAHADKESLDKAKLTEPFGYILKPFDDNELRGAIEMAVYKHRIDQKRRENESLLSTTLQSIGDGVVVTNRQEKITFINQSAATILRLDGKRVKGRSLRKLIELVADFGSEGIEDPFRCIMEQGCVLRFTDGLFRLSRGKIQVPVDGTISPMKNESEEVNGLVLTFRDVSRRMKTEEALQESKDQYRSLFEDSRDAIYITSESGPFIIGNASALAMFGFTSDEWRQHHLRELFVDNRVWKTWRKEMEKSGGVRDYEAKLLTKDKEVLDCLLTSTIRYDKDKKAIGYQGIIRDITESRSSEKSLKESESRYRLLAENVNDVIWLMDLDLTITYVTPSVFKILGYHPEEILGISLDVLLSGDSFLKAMELYKTEMRVEKQKDQPPDRSRSLELELKHKEDSVVWMEATLNFVRNESGEAVGILGAAHDISKRKSVEVDRERIQAQLFHSQKMEAVGVLAGGVAHDFNNLLTVIQGNADLALMKLDENNEVYNDLMEILTAVARAAELTGQLLLFSSKQPMKFLDLNLNGVVDGLLRMLHRLIGEEFNIRSDLEAGLWHIRADRGSLEQVIMNLAVNAKDAMTEGGNLLLKTRNASIDASSVAGLPNAIPGKYVCLSVADTGSGMDPDVLNHIFEPFFSTKEPGKGTGLGLSVAYGIVRQHQGWIHVMSEPDAGTVFEVYLPAHFSFVEDQSVESTSPSELQGQGERILVIEDSRPVRELTQTALESHGYSVRSASNAQEAMNIYKEVRGRFHLILSDVVLPDMNGLELVNTFISDKPTLRVLMISGYAAARAQWPSIQECGYRFLQKPFSLPDLLMTIRETLDSK